MKHTMLFIAFISFVAAIAGDAAQERRNTVYRLQVGDEIELLDRKVPGAEPVTVPVTPDGLLHLPFSHLNAVRAEGRTIDEVKQAIYEEFKKIYKRPDIMVVPRKIVGGNKIDVIGPVQRPGRHPYRSGMTVMDALSVAEGLRENVVPSVLYIIRGGQELLSVDMRKLLDGERAENKPLQPDDVVIVKEREGQVTVYGHVEKPSVHPWHDGMRVVQAIAQSEGLKAGADLRHVVVLREGKRIPVNLLVMQETGDLSQNISLQPDDTVFVPRADRTVVVLGGVKEPGTYEFAEGSRVLGAVSLAGGFDETVDHTGVIRVKRGGKELTLDLSRVRRTGEADDNVPLEPHDVVVVPVRGIITVVGEVKQVGTYPMKPEMRLTDAIGIAQGWTSQANRSLVRIFRDGQVIDVDASQIEQGDIETNVRLEPGDTVLVTALQAVSVFGAVAYSGTIPLPPDPRIFNVLAAAGGWLTQQATEEATVLRTQSGKLVPLIVNLKKLQEGDPSQNTLIKPGDVVIVPFKKEPQNLQKAQNILSLISTASYIRFMFGQR